MKIITNKTRRNIDIGPKVISELGNYQLATHF